MKVTKEKIENSQVSLNVEMEDVELDEYMGKAYNHLVGRVSVPGFRKGKTPRAVLERHVGKDAFLKEALEHMIPEAYQKALEEQEVDPIAQPEIQLIQEEPVIFKAIVPVRPEVKLGDYKAVRMEPDPVEIGEDDVNTALEQLRNQNAVLLPVDRPVKLGDTVTMDIEGESGGKPFQIQKDLVYELFQESPLPLPGFAEKMEGIKKGEETSFTLSYPQDYKMGELAGKDFSFKVKVTEIKEKELPELNDEFAQSVDSTDLAALREKISDDLKTRAGERARMEFEQRLVDTVVEASEVEYPPVLVESEIDRLLNEEARGFTEGVRGLEGYLNSINKTMDQHRDELRPIADKRVIRSLVLGKIAEEEKIEVDAPEIDGEIDKMVGNAGERADEMRQFFNLPQARTSIEQVLISRKTMERLKQIVSGSEEPVTE